MPTFLSAFFSSFSLEKNSVHLESLLTKLHHFLFSSKNGIALLWLCDFSQMDQPMILVHIYYVWGLGRNVHLEAFNQRTVGGRGYFQFLLWCWYLTVNHNGLLIFQNSHLFTRKAPTSCSHMVVVPVSCFFPSMQLLIFSLQCFLDNLEEGRGDFQRAALPTALSEVFYTRTRQIVRVKS